ncbi:MAG: hypothetical protein IPM55_01510 [Acidobacteria bacterium]|nr:hypothetical protein [Acidobacteriota bacterium]
MQLSDSQLQQIMPKLPASMRMIYLAFLNRVMQIYRIDQPLRASAFLAQLAHESGELRFMEEIWGPTPQQLKYEPPSDLAKRLGNTQPGDGFRYRGRGPIQITGRFNYRKYGNLLGVDIESIPDLATTPQIAFSIAGVYWQSNGLNELADVQDFITITKKINGGLNGLESRMKYYERAKIVLGVQSTRGVRTRSASMTVTTTIVASSVNQAQNALPRGYEAIEEAMAASTSRPKPAKPTKPASAKSKAPAKKAAVKPAAKAKAPARKVSTKPSKKAPVKSVKAKPAVTKSSVNKTTSKKAASKKPVRKAAKISGSGSKKR